MLLKALKQMIGSRDEELGAEFQEVLDGKRDPSPRLQREVQQATRNAGKYSGYRSGRLRERFEDR